MDTNTDIQVSGGNNQIVARADHLNQTIYQTLPAPEPPRTPACVVVLGAGVDATLGMPLSTALIPRIADFLQTPEGQGIEEALRRLIPNLRFSFRKFLDNTIDQLLQHTEREALGIRQNILHELEHNDSLTPEERKLGDLIARLFLKIHEIRTHAQIDDETEQLLREVLQTEVRDEAIIDLGRITYTETFRSALRQLLERSMHESESPILRHVGQNLFDSERLLRKYFVGFYDGKISTIRNYCYIAWMMWAYLVHTQQQALRNLPEGNLSAHPVYGALDHEDLGVVSFNYSTFAQRQAPGTHYFHGNLSEYIDIENKAERHIDDLEHLDLKDFFQHRLAMELSFDSQQLALPIPTFLPPMKLKPVISHRYIHVWYNADQYLKHASRILILGYSFANPDDFFAEMLRTNRTAEIIIVDRDIDKIFPQVCRVFQFDARRASPTSCVGHPARQFDNRITLLQADLNELDLTALMP